MTEVIPRGGKCTGVALPSPDLVEFPVPLPQPLASHGHGSLNSKARENSLIAVLLTVAMVLRVLYACRYRVNTDEPQHLHVVWSWTRGLLQYRDVFDNHMPLFHLLMAPAVAWVGERPDILIWARFLMIPLYGLAFWSLYRIGAELFDRRAGVWAIVLTALYPGLLPISVEFRADALWAALWLLALALLVRKPLTRKRCLTVGLVLGATLGTSLKTILLLGALGGAFLMMPGTINVPVSRPSFRATTSRAAAMLLGIFVVPVALMVFFAWQNAFGPFLYGALEHNLVSGLGSADGSRARVLSFFLMLPVLWLAARAIVAGSSDSRTGKRRAVIFVASGLYFGLLQSAWPLVPSQDFLPFYPLLVILLIPAIRWAATRLRVGFKFRRCSAPAILSLTALVEVVALLVITPVWRDRTISETRFLAAVLRLTDPDDPVMDLKGEAIFRTRPFFYALETITKERIRRGLIPDDISERLIATHTTAAVFDSEAFPPRARAFLLENFLPVGPLRVAGQILGESGAPKGRAIPFRIAIPTRYAVASEYGAASGSLDGSPYTGARFLTRGEHVFEASPHQGLLVVIWDRAAAAGLLPFSVRGSR